MKNTDEYYMKLALQEAEEAFKENEVPIGAIVVDDKGVVVARAHNLVEKLSDPTAHAEMQAITAATSYFGAKYLTGCSIYVTVEPCAMCAAAMKWAQISRLVWGTDDVKFGYRVYNESLLHPKTQVLNGILSDVCENLIKKFFSTKR